MCSVHHVILIPKPLACIYLLGILSVLERVLVCVMPHDMTAQATGLSKCLAACLADIWLLPRMYPHMPIQVAGRRERLATRLADIRLLPRMRPHVTNQGAGLRERLVARLANMRLLS